MLRIYDQTALIIILLESWFILQVLVNKKSQFSYVIKKKQLEMTSHLLVEFLVWHYEYLGHCLHLKGQEIAYTY